MLLRDVRTVLGCARMLVLFVLTATGCGSGPPSQAVGDDDDTPGPPELPDTTTTDDAGQPELEPDAAVVAEPETFSFELDPGEVYAIGTLAGEYRDPYAYEVDDLRVVFDPSGPERIMGLFPPGWVTGVISPADHGLHYFQGGTNLFKLSPDPIAFDGGQAIPPTKPAKGNDIEEPWSPCPSVTALPQGIAAVLFDASGEAYYQCNHKLTWLDSLGESFKPCAHEEDPTPLRAGANDAVLCKTSVARGTLIQPLEGAESTDWLTLRNKPEGGFWAVTVESGVHKRWTIHEDGKVTLDGAYATMPADWHAPQSRPASALSSKGALYRVGTAMKREFGVQPDFYEYEILRFSEDFTTVETLVTQTDDHMARLLPLGLITGQ